MRKHFASLPFLLVLSLALVTALIFSPDAAAQQTTPDAALAALPDAPGVSTSADAAPSDDQAAASNQSADAKTSQPSGPPKRMFLIIPNFRNVYTTTVLPPQSVKEKFKETTQDTFDYSALALDLILSSFSYGEDATPQFGSGGVAYGRYLWHSAADQVLENYMVEFIVPAIAHEDTRYYTLGHGGAKKRSIYSLSQIFVTKSDTGKRVFNSGEIIGAGLSSALGELYYPSASRSAHDVLQKYVTNLGIDAFSFFLREFYTEINRTLTHQDIKPI